MADTYMTEPEETEIEVITADETTQEFDIGEAPQDDDDDAMEDDDNEGKISAEDADVRDDADMVGVFVVEICGGDDVGVIWNREDGNVLYTLSGHQDSVVGVDFSFDGKYAATGGYDGVVKVWEVATGNLVQSLEGPSQEVEWVCWHKKGNVVLAGSGDGTVWMWLATTGECMHVFAGHEDGVTCGSFTGSGKMIVTGSTDGTVRVWNPKTGECNHQPLALSGSQDGTARLIQVQTKRVLATLSHDGVDPSVAGTVNDTTTSTENSVEWTTPKDAGWPHGYGARHGFIPAFEGSPIAGLLTASDDESVRLFQVDN
ncbi:hypothetical protein PInf_012046 [Phytophthora infestans]|nr:hypothetical protein PInf_012046 [Phytophthora infestans]